jgi:hypothetical protein
MPHRPTPPIVHAIALCAALIWNATWLSSAYAQADPPTESELAEPPPERAEPPTELAGPSQGDAPPYRRFHLGTSLFVLVSFVPSDQSPAFANLNFGVRLTPKDVLIFEAITWQYHEPLGIPWGPDKGNLDNAFPGRVLDIGIGVAYQRFLWKGAYAALHATPFHQTYLDAEGKRIQSGFQLFMTARFGYHFAFAKNRVFIEPSVAFTAWPINTNLPDDFAVVEDRWSGYFLFEPGLHFGVKF